MPKIYVESNEIPATGKQVEIFISQDEYEQIPPRGSRSRRVVKVGDEYTGKFFMLRRVSCSLPHCRCAVGIVEGPSDS